MSKLVRLIVLVIISFLFAWSEAYANTRNQTVNWAVNNQATPGWVPINIRHTWPNGIIFQCKYTTKSASEYADYPYVYGGNDSPQNVRDRILGGAVPGGVNNDPDYGDYDTSDIYEIYALQPSQQPAAFLAGIDCSGFASRALGIAKQNTAGLAAVSVKREDSSDVQVGDLLIRLSGGPHVKVVTTINPLGVVEAAEGDIGKVVERNNASIESGYEVYSPFPVFSGTFPADGAVLNDAGTMISAQINTGADTFVSQVSIKVDNEDVTYLADITGEGYSAEASIDYIPLEDLTEGIF
ncbi:MAG TPA: hypothetical protein PLL10_03205 [Elusimicrobiales bacterium]|nr:hypothetical protein [Elusimicrobiales bacterium]